MRPRLVRPSLASAINAPPNVEAAPAGTLDAATLEATGHLAFRGWASAPGENRPADCVVLGFEATDGVWKPFCVFETGGKRPDLASHFGNNTLDRAGFFGRVDATSLPRTNITIKAWAIDLPKERAFPMSGAIRINAMP
jgi:hypothetical protein